MLDKLIRQNLFIALCAAIQTLGSFFLFDRENLFSIQQNGYIITAASGVYFTYTFLRSASITNVRYRLILAFAVFIFSLFLANLSVYSLFLLVFCGILTFFYGIQQLFPKAQQFSLRKNAWSKLITIAIVWIIITGIIPAIDSIQLNSYLFFACQFLFVFALTIPFDFEDFNKQTIAGYSTLPALYGKDITKKIGRFVIFSAWICTGFYSMPLFYSMTICLVFYLLFLNKSDNQWGFQKLSLHFDGLLIVQVVLYIVFSLMKF